MLIEALDPALMTVLDKLHRKEPDSACLCLLRGLIDEGKTRTELQEAAAEFADAMVPRAKADAADPATYLKSWVQRYENAQTTPPGDEERKSYEQAAAKFADRVSKVLEDLRPEEAEKDHEGAAARRRKPRRTWRCLKPAAKTTRLLCAMTTACA